MYNFVGIVLMIAASIVGLQLALLTVQFLGSMSMPEGSVLDDLEANHIAQCAVVVPAHDEEAAIVQTVNAIRAQLNPTDRLIVVADNCTDTTAALASNAGAETIERNDAARRGKGFALDYGIKHLEGASIPQVVVFIDADCIVAPGCISSLVNEVQSTGHPVQGKYLMHATVQNSAMRIAEFAFKIKNYIRPGGGSRFGLPCLLYGTAMAIPWNLLRGSILANGHLTEDLKLAIDLSLLGFPPIYCYEAECNSSFPETKEALLGQRKRWEHGYFASVIAYAPKLLMKSFTSRDWRLFAVALDLSIPPLGLMLVITAFISCLGVASISLRANIYIAPLLMSYFPFFTILMFLIWYFHGRQLISNADVFATLKHALVRVSLLWGFLTRPQRKWVRTERKSRK
jgi:cellulose synthase/poly-beta-1,6-N-acetylglucosamine synthase-like glycosyltransferase